MRLQLATHSASEHSGVRATRASPLWCSVRPHCPGRVGPESGGTQMSPQSGPPCLLKPVCVPFGNRRCPEKTCGGAAGGRAVGIGTIFSRMPRERRPWWACRGCDSRTAGRERTRTEGPSVCIYLWYVSLHFLQRKGSFSVPFTGPRINCTFLKPLGSRSPTVPFPGESGVCV